ncbi:MAG: hypothetical protein AAF433_12830 [Bacteroidota bacterium]
MPKHSFSYAPFLNAIYLFVVSCTIALFYLIFQPSLSKWSDTEIKIVEHASPNTQALVKEEDSDRVVDGIHLETGLIYAEGFDMVRGTCTACHSAKLVTQNRATKEGWTQMIRWMQQTQGLWELGESESTIVNYLAKHYGPQEVGRRANLEVEALEWYVLELEE